MVRPQPSSVTSGGDARRALVLQQLWATITSFARCARLEGQRNADGVADAFFGNTASRARATMPSSHASLGQARCSGKSQRRAQLAVATIRPAWLTLRQQNLVGSQAQRHGFVAVQPRQSTPRITASAKKQRLGGGCSVHQPTRTRQALVQAAPVHANYRTGRARWPAESLARIFALAPRLRHCRG